MNEDELDDILNREATRRKVGEPVCTDGRVKTVMGNISTLRDLRVEQIDRTITMLQTYRALVLEGLA
jgi:hypothetical protein